MERSTRQILQRTYQEYFSKTSKEDVAKKTPAEPRASHVEGRCDPLARSTGPDFMRTYPEHSSKTSKKDVAKKTPAELRAPHVEGLHGSLGQSTRSAFSGTRLCLRHLTRSSQFKKLAQSWVPGRAKKTPARQDHLNSIRQTPPTPTSMLESQGEVHLMLQKKRPLFLRACLPTAKSQH